MKNKYNDIITGHYFNKHESANPLVRFCVIKYRRTLQQIISELPVYTVLEIGSGEGYILKYICEVRSNLYLVGSDITLETVQTARRRELPVEWLVARGEYLPFASRSFDLTLACEVLEHTFEPERVLAELQRVTKQFCIISVPDEPIWRILNVLRGRYLREWGNTPGHIQHWSVKGITRLCSNYFEILKVARVLPWIFVLGRTAC